jgi:CheY-like chemotaxis protein
MRSRIALAFDDNPLSLALLEDVLAEKKYEVKSFADPSLFMVFCDHDICRAESPCADVLLTDNQMPVMNGFDFLKALKEKRCKIPDNRKAIISGSFSQEQLEQAKQLGYTIFQKPAPLDELFTWLDG